MSLPADIGGESCLGSCKGVKLGPGHYLPELRPRPCLVTADQWNQHRLHEGAYLPVCLYVSTQL